MSGKHIIHSSLRRAARPLIQTPRQRRNFTSTPCTQNSGAARSMIARQMSREKSLQSKLKSAKGAEIPDDLGLFPDTLIKPERKDLPSLFSTKIKRRLQIEWTAFYSKVREFFSQVLTAKIMVKKHPKTKKRLREPLFLKDRYSVARALHKQLYESLAKGDREGISKIACRGLQNALRTRLDHRRAVNGPAESWTIKYKGWTPKSEKTPWLIQALVPASVKSTRVVTDRMGQIPIGKESSMRQVVVKIRSEQTLDKNDGKGPKTRYVEEYVVIQKMKIDGEAGDWMIWGTTQPSSEQQIDELFRAGKQDLSRVDEIKNNLMGG